MDDVQGEDESDVKVLRDLEKQIEALQKRAGSF